MTQVSLGYNLSGTFGVHLEAPFISREYRRLTLSGAEEGRTAGFGDLSLFVGWNPVQFATESGGITVKVYGGLELPTGDSDRLMEREPRITTVESTPPILSIVPQIVLLRVMRIVEGRPVLVTIPRRVNVTVVTPGKPLIREEKLPTGIRAPDLALGSGSVDGIVGGTVQARWKQFFVTADARYTIHSEGEFDYRYGDQFQWTGGPGVYLWSKPEANLAVQLVCSGEMYGEDAIRARRQNNTAMTAVFLGPSISASWRKHLSAQVGLELPVHINNSSLQLVPDYQVQASIAWQF